MTDFKRYLLDEFAEDYQEGQLSRREALKLIAGVTGGPALANTILAACTPPPQATMTAAPTGAPTALPVTEAAATPPPPAETPLGEATESASGDIEAGDGVFQGEDATLLGYLARPAGVGPWPAVLVCHENRGLTEHIKDVTRRLARPEEGRRAGYVGLAIDLLSRQGGTAAMQQNNKIYEKDIYPNTDHAFHNDTGPRYNAEAAQDAWARTLAWFDEHLKRS